MRAATEAHFKSFKYWFTDPQPAGTVDHRYYWTENGWNKKAKRPSWIGKENPEWLHNYTVKFWNQGWKDIIYAKPKNLEHNASLLAPRMAVEFTPEMSVSKFIRDNVYTYLIYDPANAKLFFSEQDQRDGGLVNTTLSHGVVAVDLTQWHRVVFDLDFVGGRSSLRVVGGGATLDEPLQWPEVNWYGTAWLGTSFVYGTQAPLAMHFDDFALTVW